MDSNQGCRDSASASEGGLPRSSSRRQREELCEAIAKLIIAERGGVPTATASMSVLISMAHKLLDFQPGEGLANDAETRKVAQGLKSLVIGLGEKGTVMRLVMAVPRQGESPTSTFDAALLWSGWAVRRLEPYIAGDVTALVRDLETEIFHPGDLSGASTRRTSPVFRRSPLRLLEPRIDPISLSK